MNTHSEPVFEAEPRKKAPTLAEFAEHSQITEDKVWELIEDGQISARFVGDRVLILPELPTFERVEDYPRTEKIPEFANESIRSPDISARGEPVQAVNTHDFIEDNHDILVFAQDALSRNAALSKELLETKDELLRLKDERIGFLTELLSQKEKEIRNLHRNIEEQATLKKFEGY